MSPACTVLHGLVDLHRLHCFPLVDLRYVHPPHTARPKALKQVAPFSVMTWPTCLLVTCTMIPRWLRQGTLHSSPLSAMQGHSREMVVFLPLPFVLLRLWG
eukprot:15065507-Heterocapsa_arctica.AAC.1